MKTDVPFDDINNFIRKDATRRGLTQTAVARETNTDRSMVNLYWQNKLIVPMKFVLNYGEFVGVPTSDLFRMIADEIDSNKMRKPSRARKMKKKT